MYKETEEKRKVIKKEVEQLLKMGKIRKSWSEWASPVTLAKKKDGGSEDTDFVLIIEN
jgi:hypothetical protein